MKTKVDRAYLICSNVALRKKERNYLKKVFHEKNNYLKLVINQFLNEIEEKQKSGVYLVNDLKRHLLVLPYKGQESDFVIKSMKKRLKTQNLKTDVAFQGKKLSSCFNIKDKTKFPHKHDLVYHAKCAEESCNDDYVGGTARRTFEKGVRSQWKR